MPKIKGESVVYTPWEKIAVAMIGILAGVGMSVSAWSLKLQLDNKDSITAGRTERAAIILRLEKVETWGPESNDPLVRHSDFSIGVRDILSEMRALRNDIGGIRETTTRTEEQVKTVNMRIDYIEKHNKKE